MGRKKFTEDDFLYPSSDNMPKADGDLHRKLTADIIARLGARYAADPNAYVSGGIRVYCEEWNPYDLLVPDCFIVFGVPKHDRLEYRGWAEGRMPTVVLEVVTRYTDDQDKHGKLRVYRDRWRVEEYFTFDPLDETELPGLQGYRSFRGDYIRVPERAGEVNSETLGITLGRDGTRLILRDTATGGKVLTAAEAEVARLTAELAGLRKKS